MSLKPLPAQTIGKYVYTPKIETENGKEIYRVCISLAMNPAKVISSMTASDEQLVSLATIYLRGKFDKSAKF